MAANQESELDQCRKPTKREEFLKTMDTIVPWTALCKVSQLHDSKADNGHSPVGLERMLRIHFIQH